MLSVAAMSHNLYGEEAEAKRWVEAVNPLELSHFTSSSTDDCVLHVYKRQPFQDASWQIFWELAAFCKTKPNGSLQSQWKLKLSKKSESRAKEFVTCLSRFWKSLFGSSSFVSLLS